MTKCLSAEYKPNSKPKKFLKFLDEVFEGNNDKIEYVRKILAYCMTGETNEQKFFIFYGEGANGKSVLLDVFSNILGEYSATGKKTAFMDNKNSSSSDEYFLANLPGKRLVLVNETKNGDKLSEAFVKEVTGGDNINARQIFGKSFEFKPEFKLIFVTNHVPRIDFSDSAIKRRIVPIKFGRVFQPHERNNNLTNELLEERDEIVSWIVDCKIYDTGLGEMSDNIKNDLDTIEADQDILQQWIDEMCLTNNVEDTTKLSVLLHEYNRWAKRNKYYEMNPTSFGMKLAKKFTKIKKNDGGYYKGITVKEYKGEE